MNNKTRTIVFIIIGCLVLCHSGIVAATTITAPSTLTALAKSSTQIFLGWKDNSTNETGFKVEKKQGVAVQATPGLRLLPRMQM
jgi:hypothetical protein